MQATYSSVNKSILGTKAVILAFLFHFISPVLVLLSLPTASEHHPIVRGLIVVIVVALIEYCFLKIGELLNSSAIKNKLKGLESQITDLEGLKEEEEDPNLLNETDKILHALKLERINLTAGRVPK